ncbi:MAG: hypothetical protein BHW00_06560 [Clostridium sp. 26_22]|nr:MAG: hypothetical protein BHW00_06560 [Clostridium sp. 26_22]
MKEIGGFFGIEVYNNNNKYYKNGYDFNYARNCLDFIIKERKIDEIYLPVYLCNSVKEKCIKAGCKINYYHIKRDFTPDLEKINKNSYIYIVNYYGWLDTNKIKELKEKFRRIIVDNAQAFFNDYVDNIDTIYSYRKFFGVPDGACLITDLKTKENFDRESVSDIVYFLVGRNEKNANKYYDDFRKSEVDIKEKKIKKISLFSENILNAIDYEQIKKIRESNFNFLHNKLKEINKLNIKNVIYYMYPLLLEEKQDEIRKKLIDNKIYIPKLWPNITGESVIEKEYINNILPIPIDQRYSINDMEYILNIILN